MMYIILAAAVSEYARSKQIQVRTRVTLSPPCVYCGRAAAQQTYGKGRRTCDGCGAPRNAATRLRDIELFMGSKLPA